MRLFLTHDSSDPPHAKRRPQRAARLAGSPHRRPSLSVGGLEAGKDPWSCRSRWTKAPLGTHRALRVSRRTAPRFRRAGHALPAAWRTFARDSSDLPHAKRRAQRAARWANPPYRTFVRARALRQATAVHLPGPRWTRGPSFAFPLDCRSGPPARRLDRRAASPGSMPPGCRRPGRGNEGARAIVEPRRKAARPQLRPAARHGDDSVRGCARGIAGPNHVRFRRPGIPTRHGPAAAAA
jgi:hypothetical protein